MPENSHYTCRCCCTLCISLTIFHCDSRTICDSLQHVAFREFGVVAQWHKKSVEHGRRLLRTSWPIPILPSRSPLFSPLSPFPISPPFPPSLSAIGGALKSPGRSGRSLDATRYLVHFELKVLLMTRAALMAIRMTCLSEYIEQRALKSTGVNF